METAASHRHQEKASQQQAHYFYCNLQCNNLDCARFSAHHGKKCSFQQTFTFFTPGWHGLAAIATLQQQSTHWE